MSTDGYGTTETDSTTDYSEDAYPTTEDPTQTGTGGWVTEDLDGDGVVDAAYQVLGTEGWEAVVDTDGDSVADTYAVDADGDGVPEATVVRVGDSYVVSVDTDGDGVADTETTLTRDEVAAQVPDLVQMLDLRFDGAPDDGTAPTDVPVDGGAGEDGWVQDGQLVGDPTGDAEHWFEQGFNGSCVPASVTQIVAEYTGVEAADEAAFIDMANEQGLWVVGPDGVPGIGVEGAVTMLNEAGVPAELTYSSTDELSQYLEDGRGVICYVDSGEIWYGDETTEDDTIDHAVVVTGIDHERGVVIVSDTGDPNGNMAEYPIEQFEDAWADGGNAIVVCDQPPAGEADQTDETDEAAGAAAVGSSADPAIAHATDSPWVLVPVFLAGALSR